jgi:hypothetical protein
LELVSLSDIADDAPTWLKARVDLSYIGSGMTDITNPRRYFFPLFHLTASEMKLNCDRMASD